MGLLTASGGAVSLVTVGLGLILLQLAVTVALPIIQHFLFYNLSDKLLVVPIVTWCLTGVPGVLGLLAFASRKGLLLGLHVAMALSCAALNGAYNTQFFLDTRLRCSIPQSGPNGCGTCACATSGTCKQAAFEAGGACEGCKALGTDVCDEAHTLMSLLPWMGLIQAVLIALPVLASAPLLARVEAEAGHVLRKMTKAKLLLAEDLARHEANAPLLTPLPRLAELVRLVARYGSHYDRQLAGRAARAWDVDISDIVKPPKMKAPKTVLPITIKVGDDHMASDGRPIDMPSPKGGLLAPLAPPSGAGKSAAKKRSAPPPRGPGGPAPPPRQLNVGPR